MTIQDISNALLIAGASIDDTLKPLPNVQANSDTTQLVFNIIFGITGAVAVLVITINGFRYIASGGDPQGVAQAKNGILYALIGLLVTITGALIVNFVLRNL